MTSPKLNLSKLPSAEELDNAAAAREQRRKETAKHLLDVATRLRDGQELVKQLTKEYARAYTQAAHDAWSVSELSEQGFPNPSAETATRRKRPAADLEAPRLTQEDLDNVRAMSDRPASPFASA